MLDSQNVDTAAESPYHSSETTLIARIGWGTLIVATLYVCYLSHLGAIGLVGPDEPRYAWIARDMMESGDWVTPRLYGKPWFEKPPLLYWSAGLCFKWFGVSEGAARLPSALCALLATLALAWLALRLYGGETARWLLLVLPTTVGMIGFSHAAATDMPFAGMLTIAMVCAAVVLGLTHDEHTPILPRTPWLALLWFGFFLGLAVLAKGPAAIILCGGTVFFWALFAKRWRAAFRLLHPVALASFLLTALPWYVACALRNPDFLRVFILEHNFKRYFTPEFQHVQPFWFYLPILLVAFIPWTVALLWSLSEGTVHLWRTRSAKESNFFFLSWAGFCIVFFSVSQSKLPGYVLPAVLPIGLLLAHSCSALGVTQQKPFRLALLTTAMICFTLSAAAEWAAARLFHGDKKFGVAAGLVVAAIGGVNLLFGGLYPPKRSFSLRQLGAASSVLPILLTVSTTNRLLPSFFLWDPSGRSLARGLQLRKIPANEVLLAGMSRGLEYSLDFYMHQEMRTWDKNHPTEGYLLVGLNGCRYNVPAPFVCDEVPFDLESTGRFLYRITLPNSVQGAPGGRQAQEEK